MISKISFRGNVYYTSVAKDYGNSHKDNTDKIKKYADKNNVDIFILQNAPYEDGSCSYRSLISKENQFWIKTFDFGQKGEDKSSKLVRCPSRVYSELMNSGYKISNEEAEFDI